VPATDGKASNARFQRFRLRMSIRPSFHWSGDMTEPSTRFKPIRRLLFPVGIGFFALLILALWFAASSARGRLALRIPGTDRGPNGSGGGITNPVLAGKLILGEGKAADLSGIWPGFRGPERDGSSKESVKLLREWDAGQPRQLWSADLGEGYAGAAIRGGKVYLMDYDQQKKQDALRCLSLADGREIWRFAYPNALKRNHGMSRTVPATTDKFVVAIGPKCDVVCVDAESGELRWGFDMVREFGSAIPPWYAGQCPLIESNAVILAPGGKNALLASVALDSGKTIWETPNPRQWKMTHSSVMPMEAEGEPMYVYCANNGVVGISAKDGGVLWETTDWKISLATVPSPLPLPGDKIFLSGGYNSGSMLLQLKKEAGRFQVHTLFKLPAEVFGATQHTPIFYKDHIYGVRADGKFICLGLDGKVAWTSDASVQFGLGAFLLADGFLFAMNDSGLLRLLEATPDKYHAIAEAQVLHGRESWGPLALAGGRLIARDFTKMVCLEVAPP